MARWLVLAFLTVPLIEIYVIVQVGQVIGGWWTVGLLFVISILGAWLIRREGRRTWLALVDAMNTGRLPTRELMDAAIVLVAGTLLLTPGFVTDVVGTLMLLPITRPLARRMVQTLVSRHILAGNGLFWMRGAPQRGTTSPDGPSAFGGPTIPGEVVDDDSPD